MAFMHAVVRSITSPDAGADPPSRYQPPSPDLFSVYLELEIGPSEGEGADVFGLTVCSPRWLLQQQRPKGFEFMHAALVLERWDPEELERAVHDLCRRTSGIDWKPIALSLGRYLAWEFADYRD